MKVGPIKESYGEISGTFRYGEPFVAGWQPAQVLWVDETTSKRGNPMLKITFGLEPVEVGETGCKVDGYFVVPSAAFNAIAFGALGWSVGQSGEFEPRDLRGLRPQVEITEGEDKFGNPRAELGATNWDGQRIADSTQTDDDDDEPASGGLDLDDGEIPF